MKNMQKKLYRKKIILIALLIIFGSIDKVHAVDDTMLHFGVSAACGAGIETYLHYETELETTNRFFLSSILCTVPGLAKELIDSTQEDNEFSVGDLSADIAGAIVGTLVSSKINDVIKLRIDLERKNEQQHSS